MVCPPSLMEQWAREVSSKCERGVLCSYTYHGVENKQITEGQLTKYDVVITTYNTVTMEYNVHMRIDDEKEVRLYNVSLNLFLTSGPTPLINNNILSKE